MTFASIKARAILLAGVLALIAGIGSQTASAAVVVVGTCASGTQFSTIGAALASSLPSGSTIKICPGTYNEQLTITQNLTLLGVAGPDNTDGIIISPPGTLTQNATSISTGNPIAANIAVVGAPGTPISVNLTNLIVDSIGNGITCPSTSGTNVVGILYQRANGIVRHVTARNQLSDAKLSGCQGGYGIFAEDTGLTDVVTVQNSSVHDYNKNGIVGNNVTLNVLSSVVAGSGPTPVIAQNGIELINGATGKISANRVSGDQYTGDQPASASGILLYNATTGTSLTPLLNNYVNDIDFGVALVGISGAPDSSGYTINGNHISHSISKGIELCSTGNTLRSNSIFGSGEAGIYLDSSNGCGAASNSIMGGQIAEVCAGVLGDNTVNAVGPAAYFNDVYTTLNSQTCPSASMALAARALKAGSNTSTGTRRVVQP